MSVDIYSDKFVDNLPESINWDTQVQAIGGASDTQAVGLQGILPELLVLCNIPNLPESTLDLLAFQFQVLFYGATNLITDPVARLAAKQQLIANNFYYHAHLGTAATVQQIASSVFQPAIVQEWFHYGGLPNHFRVLLQQVIDSTTQAEILSLVTVVKRASQAMDGFFLYTSAPTNFYVAVGVFTQIWLFLPLSVGQPHKTFLSPNISIFASATVQRSSAHVGLSVGAAIVASPRRVASGAVVVDIRAKSSVNVIIRALRAAAVQIIAKETISGTKK